MEDMHPESFFENILVYNSKEFVQKIDRIFAFGVNTSLLTDGMEKVSIRQEANVLTSLLFRNTDLEKAHATSVSSILTYKFIKELMKKSSHDLQQWLIMRDDLLENIPTLYSVIVKSYEYMYTSHWDASPIISQKGERAYLRLHLYTAYDIKMLGDTLYELLEANSSEFIHDILQYCNGAIKKNQHSIKRVFSRKCKEAPVLVEYCFARSIPTDWYGKDMLNDSNMKNLMIRSSEKLAEWLTMRDTLLAYHADLYDEIICLLTESFSLS